MGRSISRAQRYAARDLLPDASVALAALVLTWPMWASGGYGLARDLVFTPRAPWTVDAIGMGSSLPRAVPLDAVLAALTSVVDGAIVFRVAVVGVLLVAGTGAPRFLRTLVPEASVATRCAVAVAAVWNPYVVERLALGQWALLASYAALWWLLPAVRRVLAGERQAWFVVVAATWLGSLTPTGGAVLVLVAAAAVAVALVRRAGRARAGWVLAVTVVAQLPWVLAGVLGGAPATSDATAVDAFAARAERPGGVWPTLVGTGGVWSPFQVPGSLTSVPGYLLTVVVALALVVGGARVVRGEPALVVAAAAGFLLAGAAHLPGGTDALGWAVGHVPGAGMLRDGQKWLLPYVVLVVAAVGVAVARAETAVRRRDADLGRFVVGALALLPVVLLPDAAERTWEVVEPVRYPAELAEAVAVLDDADGTGDVVTLPWASYRRFSWGNPVSAADPLPRWTRRPTVVSDTLAVPGGDVLGEDPRAAEIGAVVAEPSGSLAEPLADLGVGWVLVYRDQPGAGGLDMTGMSVVVHGPEVELSRVPGLDTDTDPGPGRATTLAVAAVDVLWGLAWAVAAVGSVVGMFRARRRVAGGSH